MQSSIMAPREIQFIISLPNTAGVSETIESQRKAAHSHAARSAHAKVRRQRIKQYQAQKRREGHGQSRDAKSLDGSQRELGLEMLSPLSTHRKDPFMILAKSLTSIEQMLFDHYVTAIIPLMRCNELAVYFSQRMTRSWIPLAITEANLLNLIFLASCRHLSVSYQDDQRQDDFTRLAFQYKLRSLQSLRDAISVEAPVFNDSTVAKAIMLAYDELFVRDTKMLKHHVDGAVKMVALRGGPHTLGLDGLLEHLLSNLLLKRRGEVGLVVNSPWENKEAYSAEAKV